MAQISNLLGVARTRRLSVFKQPWNRHTLMGALGEMTITLLIVYIPGTLSSLTKQKNCNHVFQWHVP
jgi:hypothetical protein